MLDRENIINDEANVVGVVGAVHLDVAYLPLNDMAGEFPSVLWVHTGPHVVVLGHGHRGHAGESRSGVQLSAYH